jgi:hypothetical protein
MAAAPQNMPMKMPRMGTAYIYSAIYQLQDENGNVLFNTPYRLTTPSGQTATGYSDDEGRSVPVYTRQQENVDLHILTKKRSRKNQCGLWVKPTRSNWKQNSGRASHNGNARSTNGTDSCIRYAARYEKPALGLHHDGRGDGGETVTSAHYRKPPVPSYQGGIRDAFPSVVGNDSQ